MDASALSPRGYLRVLALSALLGIPAAAAAVVYTSVLHGVETGLWHDLPQALGWSQPPWWMVIALPALAGVLVAAALRLPGHGGHPPLDEFSVDPVPIRALPGILGASLASLALGPVVGPEVPLVAIGLALGLQAGRFAREGLTEVRLLGFAGAFAALSTAFGGPLPSALLLFEVAAASGMFAAPALGRLLAPGFLAAGVGSLLFTGVAGWPGVHEFQLGLPELPAYPSVRIPDLAWCALVAIVVGAAAVLCRSAATALARRGASRNPMWVLAGAGALIGLVAVIFRLVADRPVDLVLFSGASALAPTIAEGSTGVLVLIVLARALAFTMTIGAGFRGGMIFPAIAIGVGIAVLASHVLPGLAVTPAVVAAVAAAAAATLRAPFFGALMSALLAGAAGPETAPIAIIAAVLGWLVAVAAQRQSPDGMPLGTAH